MKGLVRKALALLCAATPAASETLTIPAVIICDTHEAAKTVAEGGPLGDCSVGPPRLGKAYVFEDGQAVLVSEHHAPLWCVAPIKAKIHAVAWTHAKSGKQMTKFAMSCEGFTVETAEGETL